MNKQSAIVTVSSMEDIKKINGSTKYINLTIDKVDMKVIDYFLLNGRDYLYSDNVNGLNGFIYVDYDMFSKSEKCIDNIIDNMPNNLDVIEMIRYIYVSIGKMLYSDINLEESKNEVISFSSISTVNNIWGSLYSRKTTSISISKLLMYLCSRVGITSELISSSINNDIGNKIYLNEDNYIVVNLFEDMPYIQGGFITKHFDRYNSSKLIDKKIGYISSDYTDYYLTNVLSNIDYFDSNVVETVLALTEKILDIASIGTLELSTIYKNIFDKYLPNYDVRINNFYVNDNSLKKHFIVINYDEEYYSYNYTINKFIEVKYDEICRKLKDKLICLYGNENFVRNKKEVLL